MSRAPTGMVMPQHVAQQKQQQMVMHARAKMLHIDVAKGIYKKIIAHEYAFNRAEARNKAFKEANQFDSAMSEEEVIEQLPESVPMIAPDFETAVRASIQAANVFLYRMHIVDAKGNPIPDNYEEQPEEKPAGIVLG